MSGIVDALELSLLSSRRGRDFTRKCGHVGHDSVSEPSRSERGRKPVFMDVLCEPGLT